jgi:hypothetical protein
MKALMEISTNPLVWIGMGLAIAYPLGSAKNFYKLLNGLRPTAKAAGGWMSQIYSSFHALRNAPKLQNALIDFQRSTDDIFTKYGDKLANEVYKGVRLTKEEQLLVGIHGLGWNKPGGHALLQKIGGSASRQS